MRVSAGGGVSVTATDRWLAEIRAGRAFASQDIQGGAVGVNSHVQLFNPAASGKILVVYRIIPVPTVTGLFFVAMHNTALVTFGSTRVNLLNGGPTGVGQVRRENRAGVGSDLAAVTLIANDPSFPGMGWWAELGQGEGIVMYPNNQNESFRCGYLWFEVPA